MLTDAIVFGGVTEVRQLGGPGEWFKVRREANNLISDSNIC
jgi:hypothetical protein